MSRAPTSPNSKIEIGALATDLAQVASGDEKAMDRVAKQSPGMNAMLRTTCVATQIEGGACAKCAPATRSGEHQLPSLSGRHSRTRTCQSYADDQVIIGIKADEGKAPPSPMRRDIMKAFAQITDITWPGVITVPEMSTGASDGRYLREAGIPTMAFKVSFWPRRLSRSRPRRTNAGPVVLRGTDILV